MNCSPFDLRDYFLRELAENDRQQVESHVRTCESCRDDLERLQLTEAALLTLPDEEIPQRIGFVSDKVFEPSAVRRFWHAFWGSAARLGFASAAMLSAALLVTTLHRSDPPPVPNTAVQIDVANLKAEFSRELDQAIRKAVAESEARQIRKTAALLATAEKRNDLDRKGLVLALEEDLSLIRKQFNRMYLASNDIGAAK